MTLYRIANWEKYFEVRDSKRIDGPLKWVAVPTKTDGFGFSRVRIQKNAADLLAAWYLMLGIAAKQDRADRGKLIRDGIPLTAEDFALITGFPVRIFVEALSFFSEVKQGWLVAEQWTTDGPPMDHRCGFSVPTGQDRTGQDRTEQHNTPASGECAQEPSEKPTTPPAEQKPSAKCAIQLRAESLFRRRESTPWSAAELRAWKTARAIVADTDDAAWKILSWWYALPSERAPYRKTDFAALLNNWHAEIEKARRNQSTKGEFSDAW